MNIAKIVKIAIPAVSAAGVTALAASKSYKKGYSQGQKDELIRSQKEAEKAFDSGLSLGFDSLGININKLTDKSCESGGYLEDSTVSSSELQKSLHGAWKRVKSERDPQLTYKNYSDAQKRGIKNGMTPSMLYSRLANYLATGEIPEYKQD